jgi:hypothetical protein
VYRQAPLYPKGHEGGQSVKRPRTLAVARATAGPGECESCQTRRSCRPNIFNNCPLYPLILPLPQPSISRCEVDAIAGTFGSNRGAFASLHSRNLPVPEAETWTTDPCPRGLDAKPRVLALSGAVLIHSGVLPSRSPSPPTPRTSFSPSTTSSSPESLYTPSGSRSHSSSFSYTGRIHC